MDSNVFPEPIRALPRADVPIEGVTAHLSQADTHQILFMSFDSDVELAEHTHEAQWGVVIEGRIELMIDGVVRTCVKGEHYFIPEGIRHSAKIFAGYADVTFFHSPDRYGSSAVESQGEAR